MTDHATSARQFELYETPAGSRRAFLQSACAAAAFVAIPACRCSREPQNPIITKAEEPAAPPPAPPGFTPPAHEPTIRVRIFDARTRGSGPIIGKDDQWIQITSDDPSTRSAVVRGPILFSRFADQWQAAEDVAGTPRTFTGHAITARNLGFEQSTIALNDRIYSGALRLVPRSDVDERAFDVVNVLPMEKYLPGVLARELYRHWEPAAFEAQAVAARSFACHELMHYASRRHFDVTDTQQSQAYIGDVDVVKALDATARTAGQILGYQGMLVPGYYCSCCGGTAASADAAIGDNPVNALPPLAGRLQPDVCHDAPLYRWTIKRDRAETIRRIAAFAQHQQMQDVLALDGINTIEPVMSSPSGRPILYQIVDRRNTFAEIAAERLRSAINHRATELPDFDRALPSAHVDVRVEDATIYFDGRGFGHGVGMCQYGAQALALKEAGYLDILRWYYPGVEIVQAYAPARPSQTTTG